MSCPPAGPQDYATMLDFVTATLGSCHDGGNELGSEQQTSKASALQKHQEKNLGSVGPPEDVAALPTVQQSNTANSDTGSGDGNQEGLNLFKLGKYDQLVVDVPAYSTFYIRILDQDIHGQSTDCFVLSWISYRLIGSVLSRKGEDRRYSASRNIEKTPIKETAHPCRLN